MNTIRYDRGALRRAIVVQVILAMPSLITVGLFDLIYLFALGRPMDFVFWAISVLGVLAAASNLFAAGMIFFSRMRDPEQLAVSITREGLVLPDAGLIRWPEIGEITFREKVWAMNPLWRFFGRISPVVPIFRKLFNPAEARLLGTYPWRERWVGLNLRDPESTLARFEEPVSEFCRSKMKLGREPFQVTEQGLSVPIESVHQQLRTAQEANR